MGPAEVAAILFYLARRFPEAGLLPPGDIEAEAQALSWMSFIASTLHPARKQGLDRRQFLRTSCGMAAAFVAMNNVFGNLFEVSEAEAADPAQAQTSKGE